MSRLVQTLLLFATVSTAFAAEDLRGNPYLVNPPDVTLYGEIRDVNNLANNTFYAQICWDDPTLTHNCDQPVPATTTNFPLTSCSGSGCRGFHYLIPTSAVGAITPRDGALHLMYIKAISQTNPGAGDVQIDGSPWPFVFRSGTVGPMWTANLESSPSRLTAAQLAILVNSQDPYSIGSTGNVVCTVSGVSIKDDGAAGYYAKRHGVPCSNISVISVPVVQTTNQSTFNSSIVPTVQALPSSIQAIALAWVQPSMVGYTSGGYNDQSISAAVANAGMVLGTGCLDGSVGLGQGPINPYFNSSSQAPFTDHHLRPTMMLAGEVCPTCTPTNNYSSQWYADFPTFKSVVDAALLATDTNPSGGNVYWTLTSDLKRSQTTVAVSPLELGTGLSPYVNAQILGTRAVPTSKTVSAQNILMYEESAPNWNYSAPTFVPGAGIGYAVTSNSGWLPSDGNQTTAASWLSQGAIGAFGNAAEPCELLAYKHVDPALVIPNYTQGQTLIESLWKSIRLPWGGNFIGDPLAAPFTLQSGTVNSTPSLTALSPSSAAPGSITNVTLTGRNFSSPATIAIQGTGVTASNITVVSPTTITASFTASPTAAPGTYNVTVSTASGVTGGLPFQVTVPSPALSSVSPASAAAGTSVQVTLTGNNFTSGAFITTGGAGLTASNVTVASASQINATFTVDPSAPAQTHSIAVTTAAGTSNTVSFTVNPGAPTLSSVSPASASPGTAVQVTITGTNFTAGATVTFNNPGVSATNISIPSATQINATVNVTTSTPPGTYTASVTTAAGTSNAVSFTVNPGAPTLSSVSPASASPGTAVQVTITGTNFTAGATVTFNNPGVSATNISIPSATQINATVNVTTSTPPGTYTASVTTSAGTSNAVSFTVNPAAPTLSSVSPASASPGTAVQVTLTGSNFTAGATVSTGGAGLTSSNITLVSASQINATFTVDPSAAPQTRNISVVTAAGISNTVAFTINGAQGAPVLSAISPASTTAGFQVNIVLTGTGFSSGASLAFSNPRITVSNVSVSSSTQINALLTVLSSISPGTYTVAVNTAAGSSNALPLTVNPIPSAPILTAMNPNSGARGTSVNVVLTGTNFTPSTGVRLGGSGASMANLAVVSPTQINITFVLSPTAATGTHNVYVTNSSGSSVTLPFTVN